MNTPLMAPCPKCRRNLKESGTITVGSKQLPIFQCSTCTEKVDIMGTEFEVAVTFALGANGDVLNLTR